METNIQIGKSSGSKKKLPKRYGRTGHRAGYTRYQARASCMACRLVFKSPKYKKAHTDSGHKSQVGVNTNKQYK